MGRNQYEAEDQDDRYEDYLSARDLARISKRQDRGPRRGQRRPATNDERQINEGQSLIMEHPTLPGIFDIDFLPVFESEAGSDATDSIIFSSEPPSENEVVLETPVEVVIADFSSPQEVPEQKPVSKKEFEKLKQQATKIVYPWNRHVNRGEDTLAEARDAYHKQSSTWKTLPDEQLLGVLRSMHDAMGIRNSQLSLHQRAYLLHTYDENPEMAGVQRHATRAQVEGSVPLFFTQFILAMTQPEPVDAELLFEYGDNTFLDYYGRLVVVPMAQKTEISFMAIGKWLRERWEREGEETSL